ncbi:MAG: hypothetical protein M3033_13670 [Acidobacteriota bacterium]|nr:hypothetical protein [Acidobacteriota bacterium]
MKFVISIILLLVLGSTELGQTKNITATTEEGKKVILKPDKTWDYEQVKKSGNIFSNTNGKRIVGDDALKVVNFFESIKNKILKGASESEKEYLARLDKVTSEIKFNGKPLNKTVFVIEPDLRYDAEGQTFTVLVSISNNIFKENNFSLEPRKWQYGKFTLHYTYLQLKISVAKAKTDTSNIQLAIYGFPVGFEKVSRKIAFVPLKYVFFNKKTGEIYSDVTEVQLN